MAGKLLNEGDVQRIEFAIAEAEKNTDGEIIPMLVRSSTNTGSVQMMLALILFVMFVFIEHEFDYVFEDQTYYYLMPICFIGFYFLAAPLSRIQFFQKWLTTKSDQIADVNLRAEVEFYRGRFHQTQKKSAILLFVSLMEKRAVVLADEAVSKKVAPEVWNEVVKLMTSDISKGEFAKGMVHAIQKSGDILSQHLPSTSAVKNEVKNHFIIKN